MRDTKGSRDVVQGQTKQTSYVRILYRTQFYPQLC